MILAFFCCERGGSTGGTEPAARADGFEEVPLHMSHVNLMMHHAVARYRLLLILAHRLADPLVGVLHVHGDIHEDGRASVEPESER